MGRRRVRQRSIGLRAKLQVRSITSLHGPAIHRIQSEDYGWKNLRNHLSYTYLLIYIHLIILVQ